MPTDIASRLPGRVSGPGRRPATSVVALLAWGRSLGDTDGLASGKSRDGKTRRKLTAVLVEMGRGQLLPRPINVSDVVEGGGGGGEPACRVDPK